MIHITSEAAKQVSSLVAEKKKNLISGLRLSIEQGGCAGQQYAMVLGSEQEGDSVLHQEGAFVFIDPKSLIQLEECTLDYEDGLTGAGFRILNPNAVRSCGCGTSFEAKK
jgi:iron-sulfur cluster assembly protein